MTDSNTHNASTQQPADLTHYRHHLPVQLRFNDIDILGHLNNTVYFSLFDLGKARYFGAVRSGKIDWQKVETVIANVNCSYIRQVRFGENIEILTRCVAIGHKSFTLDQLMVNADTGEAKAHCQTIMVFFDQETQQAAEVPEIWRRSFAEYESRPEFLILPS